MDTQTTVELRWLGAVNERLGVRSKTTTVWIDGQQVGTIVGWKRERRPTGVKTTLFGHDGLSAKSWPGVALDQLLRAHLGADRFRP